MIQTDCLIIGGGLAGWMAAYETVNAGLKTTLLQDGMGASPWVHGFNAPVHPGDSATTFLEDTLRSGQGLSNPSLAEALCNDACAAFDRLRAMSLSFNQDEGGYQTLRPLGSSYPRVVSIGNETGMAVLQKLKDTLAGRVTVLPRTRAIRLLKNTDRVTGALAFDKRSKNWLVLQARSVILACGGFCGIYPLSTNKRDSGGDGIAMAYEAGASLCDLEFIQFEPSAAVWPPSLIGTSVITTLFFEGAVLRNRNGERFMLRYSPEGERTGKDVLARRIAQEIADNRGTEHGGVYMDITGVAHEKLLSEYAMYVKRYLDVGIDISKQWIELAPAPHTSLGGIRIDAHGRSEVKGLFACGEVIGGLHGANRIGGSAGLETLVFGQRAGCSAAAYAAHTPQGEVHVKVPTTDGKPIGDRLLALQSDMRAALRGGVGAVREEKNLHTAVEVLKASLAELGTLSGSTILETYERMRLRNDMTAALLTALAAQARTASLGCHSRAEDPTKDGRPLYRVVISKGENGPELRKENP